MPKLRYVERIARKFGTADPVRPHGDTDITVDEMDSTVADFYKKALQAQPSPTDLPLDVDLKDVFSVPKRRRRYVRPAVELLRENRKALIDKVTYWTGVQRPLVRQLVESIEAKTEELKLLCDTKREQEHLTEVSTYATVLAMNYLTRGKFVQP